MARILHEQTPTQQWWNHAVIYQIYPRSFASRHGQIGDLPGIIDHLGYLADLGIDAVWLSPFYLSPQKDAGYDVADYYRVDPMFGTNDDAIALINAVHEHGLRIIVDMVPNHTSDQHVWFQAALADPNSPQRQYYWFRDGKPDNHQPPNDWGSIFGSRAWTRVCDRADAPGSPWENDTQWYLHLFDSSQPDLNWDSPEVRAEFCNILRYWLDLGVDGFRVDVAHGLCKDPELPDWQFHWDMVSGGSKVPGDVPPPPQWNRPEVHEIYREWRAVLDEYGPDRALVAEAWVDNLDDMAKFVRADEMSQAFNFDFLCSPFTVNAYRTSIRESLRAMDNVGAPTTWVLSNHDVVRVVSRMGLVETGKGPNGIRPTDPQPDAQLGMQRGLAAHLLQAGLPGSCYIYQGEELALPEHTGLSDDIRQDPAYFRTRGVEAGRDGCRIPMPWNSQLPGFGFSPSGETWLPQPEEWRDLAVDVQLSRSDSTLALFRRLFAARAELRMAQAQLCEVEEDSPWLHYISRHDTRDDVHILTVFDTPTPLPTGAEIIISSRALDEPTAPGESYTVPCNCTVWFTLSS
ncbi:glycoside hydrolase family 13 protein [Trueperella sp. LYQ143]|uniref:glycoside hydrolase family 13 protein n=1 Tax=Trueperella sp. LYQ143 TaxID=3391059 RepID=UPI0039833257